MAPGIFTCKNSWIRKNRLGIYEMYLEGSPFEVGLINGILTRELIQYQEEVFVARLREMVPSPRYINALKYFIAWFNRDMDEYVPKDNQEEIYGVSMAASPEFEFIAPNYQRILNYHAAHDIGHAMQNLNLVGCTAFAAWNGDSEDSTLIIGRNFDFYMGEDFARNKIVVFLNPDKGYRLMMLTWGGMTGVVSGMNEKGLTITLNSAKSSIPWKAKTPVSILARIILQYAATTDEAIKIARENQTFVSESFLIGSARENKAVLIEKSPEKTGVFAPSGSRLIVTNHFQGETFSRDKLTTESMAESASPYRFQRVEELLNQNPALNPVSAAGILRDRKGLKNADIGLGNEKAINQLIAHHSVIFKPAELKVWISTEPYQEGAYLCYDLNAVFNGKLDFRNEIDIRELTIPADTFLLSGEWTRYREYLKTTTWLKNRLDRKHSGFLTEAFINHYLNLNPGYYYPYFLAGRYYSLSGLPAKAAELFKTSLAKEIPRKVDREEVEAALKDVKEK
ncbi:MAG: hypothetical protein IPF68_02215 [Bacteroidales bacterium]|nr:hypothetical protein [Bacteroidales bacterium]